MGGRVGGRKAGKNRQKVTSKKNKESEGENEPRQRERGKRRREGIEEVATRGRGEKRERRADRVEWKGGGRDKEDRTRERRGEESIGERRERKERRLSQASCAADCLHIHTHAHTHTHTHTHTHSVLPKRHRERRKGLKFRHGVRCKSNVRRKSTQYVTAEEFKNDKRRTLQRQSI